LISGIVHANGENLFKSSYKELVGAGLQDISYIHR
jgi:hypothetical protein